LGMQTLKYKSLRHPTDPQKTPRELWLWGLADPKLRESAPSDTGDLRREQDRPAITSAAIC
jgi:hypothetical protein